MMSLLRLKDIQLDVKKVTKNALVKIFEYVAFSKCLFINFNSTSKIIYFLTPNFKI